MADSLKAVTECLGYQQITSLSSATALTLPVVTRNGIKMKPLIAVIISEDQGVRWRDDGTAPSGTVGMPLAAGTQMVYDGDLTNIQFIEQTASAILNVSYYA